jgi:branched-chain amino acid transport system ATP-binding protein
MRMSDGLLQIENLSVGYGEGLVLTELSFSVQAGSSLAVLGRNGVGKSTLMLAIMGHLRPSTGKILFNGASLESVAPFRRCQKGLAWVPQGREIFGPLTVEEHLLIAAVKGAWSAERIFKLFPGLADRRNNLGTQLSGGEQQMLAIGRALVTNPKLLLLDEPLEGLAPVVARTVADCIRTIVRSEGTSVMLIEQHSSFALEITRNALLLERGRLVFEGASSALASDSEKLERYVGLRRTSVRTPVTPGAGEPSSAQR